METSLQAFACLPIGLYLGFACIWVIWLMLYVSPNTEVALVGENFAGSLHQIGTLINRATLVFCFLLFIVFNRRFWSLVPSHAYSIFMRVVFPVGLLISVLGFSSLLAERDAQLIAIAIGSFLEGAGLALLLPPWLRLFITIGWKKSCLIVIGAFALGSIGFFSLAYMRQLSLPIWLILFMLLATFSSVELNRFIDNGDKVANVHQKLDDKSEAITDGSESAFIELGPLLPHIPFFVVALVCGAVYGFAQSISYETAWVGINPVRDLSLIATLLVAFGIIMIKGYDPQRNLLSVYRMSLPILVIGLLLLPLCRNNYSFLPVVVSFAGYAWFTLSMLMLAAISAKNNADSPFPFLLLYMAEGTGIIIGNYCSALLSNSIMASSDVFYFVVVVIVAILILGISVIPERKVLTIWLELQNPKSRDDLLYIEAYAASLNLTERESEVFFLLVRGKRANEISEELMLSMSTIRTHIHKIYEKLGVHSYKDMIKEVQKNQLSHDRDAQ